MQYSSGKGKVSFRYGQEAFSEVRQEDFFTDLQILHKTTFRILV